MNDTSSAPRPLDWRIGGVLLGALATLAVALQGPIGVSTAYVTTEAALAEAIAPGSAQRLAYWKQVGAALTPEWFLVIGVAAGALLSAALARPRTHDPIPAAWRARFGDRRGVRLAGAAAGGFLLLFGARLAGGCTSGHVISGVSQLAISGMVFGAAVFAAGIPVARRLYRSAP